MMVRIGSGRILIPIPGGILILALVLLAACGSPAAPENPPTVPVTASATSSPTPTSTLTQTPSPTGTPIPPSPTTPRPGLSILHATPHRIPFSHGRGSRLHPLPAGSPTLEGRIEFVILQMDRSPPAAPHPASRRRSSSWFQAGERMPGEDLHLSDQTRFQAHWEPRSARRRPRPWDDCRSETGSYIKRHFLQRDSR